MSIKPQPTRNKETIQQKIIRLGNEFPNDPKKALAKLKKITQEFETELSREDFDEIWGSNKKYHLEDIRAAKKWFRDEVRGLLQDPFAIQHKRMSKYTRRQTAITVPTINDIGKMFYYKYDPKTKDELPYYDTFPLILMVKPLKDGWQGLNLHYLPPKQREILIYRLMDRLSDVKLDNNTRLKINYEMLSSVSKYRYFKPCFKRYLYTHVRSTVRPVPIRHWAKAILLPVANFKKASQATVWSDSKRIMQGIK